jgi:hypothetical protein
MGYRTFTKSKLLDCNTASGKTGGTLDFQSGEEGTREDLDKFPLESRLDLGVEANGRSNFVSNAFFDGLRLRPGVRMGLLLGLRLGAGLGVSLALGNPLEVGVDGTAR